MFVEEKEIGEYQRLDRASKLLLQAADLIEKRGLCQNGLFTDGVGALCIMGAIDVAAGFSPGDSIFSEEDDGAYENANEAIGRVAKELPGELINWNDDPRTTKAEVVAKLRAVAFRLP